MVIRKGQHLEFDVYRKATHTDLYIDNNSFNPKPHKVAAINSMIRRMLKLPLSEENRKKEKSKIIKIAESNNFESQDVLRLISLQEYKEKIKNVTTLKQINEEHKNYSPFPYHPNFNTAFKKIFKKYGCELVPINKCNLRSRFHGDLKDPIKDDDCGGIYELTCLDCEKSYIGQTRRNIKVRGVEHRRNVSKGEVEKSAVAKHSWEEQHRVDFNPKLIKKVTNKRDLNAVEKIEIYKKREHLFNIDYEGVDNFLFNLIDKRPKKQSHSGNLDVQSEEEQHPNRQVENRGLRINIDEAPKEIRNTSRYNLRKVVSRNHR